MRIGNIALVVSLIALAFALFVLMTGCAPARAGKNPSAERVFTDQAGYTCFLIRDDEGKGVGGGCIKE